MCEKNDNSYYIYRERDKCEERAVYTIYGEYSSHSKQKKKKKKNERVL